MKKIKLIALAAALLAALAIYQLLKIISKPQETPRTEVVVAAVNIPENTTVTRDMVELLPVATEALLPGCLTDPEDAIGMVVSSDVYAGEQVISERLVRVGEVEDSSSTLAYVVQPGMRAATVAVTATSGIANLIRPGNRVDVVMNYAYEVQAAGNAQKVTVPASRLLLQDIEVLAVDAVLSKEGAAEGYSAVTLMVTPEQAVELSFAESTSSLRLILRSSLDEKTSPEQEITLNTICREGGAA